MDRDNFSKLSSTNYFSEEILKFRKSLEKTLDKYFVGFWSKPFEVFISIATIKAVKTENLFLRIQDSTFLHF